MAKRFAALVAATAGFAAPAQAQAPAEPGPVPHYIHSALQGGVPVEQFVARATAELRRVDRGGDGLDRGDIRWLERTTRALTRANNLQAVIRYDLDGDTKVTAAEVRETLSRAVQEDGRSSTVIERGVEREIRDLAWFDANADGDVTLSEVLAAPVDRARNVDRLETPRALMALPAAADGRLTAEELSAYAGALFAAADTNEDGVLSDAEAGAARQAYVAPPPPQTPGLTCRLPPLRQREHFVLIGVSDGGGPRSKASPRISSITLRIAPGSRPLYILAASGSPVRWVLEGDVERVSRMVAMTDDWGRRDSPLLVEGLEPPLAQTRPGEGCIHGFVDATSASGRSAVQMSRELLGRTPDAVVAAVAPRFLLLPPR